MTNHSRTKDAPARRTAIVRTRLELRAWARVPCTLTDGRVIEIDYRRMPTSEWMGSPLAYDPAWRVIETVGDWTVALKVSD